MHSTKTNSPANHVDRLRQQFALLGQDTFCKALGSDQVERILRDEVGSYRQRIYPPMVTLRLFIDQILSPDAACQDAVGRRLSQRAANNQSPCSLNSGPYCKARKRMALRLPERLCKHLGQSLEGQAARLWGWRGRSIKIFDATTVSMPDTPSNQQAWPQSRTQDKGLGFPMVRIGALISLASGCVMDYALGSLSGKGSGEQALLREVSSNLVSNDLLLADALHSTWWTLQMLIALDVDALMPNDGRRQVDFKQGRLLGQSDHVVWWPKPQRASWITTQQYQQMPPGIWVREVRVNDRIMVTTLLNPEQFGANELASLYAMRWNIEVDFRTLKSTMNMDVLRCKSSPMVQKEIAVYLLTYNLVRWTMVNAAQLVDVPARTLSFAGARRMIWNFAGHLRRRTYRDTAYMTATLLKSIASCVLPKRPGRVEPRAKKRRPKPLPLLTIPRQQARDQILAARNLKVVP
jgi:hypothetical protein